MLDNIFHISAGSVVRRYSIAAAMVARRVTITSRGRRSPMLSRGFIRSSPLARPWWRARVRAAPGVAGHTDLHLGFRRGTGQVTTARCHPEGAIQSASGVTTAIVGMRSLSWSTRTAKGHSTGIPRRRPRQ